MEYDLSVFYRRLRLKEYFFEENSSNDKVTEPNPFRVGNKRWNPPKNREPALETYIQAIGENSQASNRRVHDNLSKSERLALIPSEIE